MALCSGAGPAVSRKESAYHEAVPDASAVLIFHQTVRHLSQVGKRRHAPHSRLGRTSLFKAGACPDCIDEVESQSCSLLTLKHGSTQPPTTHAHSGKSLESPAFQPLQVFVSVSLDVALTIKNCSPCRSQSRGQDTKQHQLEQQVGEEEIKALEGVLEEMRSEIVTARASTRFMRMEVREDL